MTDRTGLFSGNVRIHFIYASADSGDVYILNYALQESLALSALRYFNCETNYPVQHWAGTETNWTDQAKASVEKSDLIVLVASAASIDSESCRLEYQAALKYQFARELNRLPLPMVVLKLQDVDARQFAPHFPGIEELEWHTIGDSGKRALRDRLPALLLLPFLRRVKSVEVERILEDRPGFALDLMTWRPGSVSHPRKPYVFHTFLSHTGRDKSSTELTEFIDSLATALTKRGFALPAFFLDRNWIQQWRGSDDALRQLLGHCIERSQSCVAILSPNYDRSPWCRWEYTAALQSKVRGQAHVFPLTWERLPLHSRISIKRRFGVWLPSRLNTSAKADFECLRKFSVDERPFLAAIIAREIRRAVREAPDVFNTTSDERDPLWLFDRIDGEQISERLEQAVAERSKRAHRALKRWRQTVTALTDFIQKTSRMCDVEREKSSPRHDFASTYDEALDLIQSSKAGPRAAG